MGESECMIKALRESVFVRRLVIVSGYFGLAFLSESLGETMTRAPRSFIFPTAVLFLKDLNLLPFALKGLSVLVSLFLVLKLRILGVIVIVFNFANVESLECYNPNRFLFSYLNKEFVNGLF